MRTRLLIALAVAALMVGCVPPAVTPPEADRAPGTPAVRRAVITGHTDGDTAHFRLASGVEEKVRFIGIDSPETGDAPEPFGEEASAYTAEAIPVGATVWLETDAELRDCYGRLLAYVWLAEPRTGDEAEVRALMLNARIVLAGYAYANTYLPNVSYQGILRDCQAEANAENRGLWAEHEPERQ
ncbi:MAG: thermonuclease family protein [Coriobacteriia bacterium]|nr:thermonuclease family protein [Coriobacteriia bacterium]